jgi:AmmeMemoRadiSam system protein A
MSGIVYACIAPHPPLLVHEVGRGRERETQRTIDALSQVAEEMASHKPETVIIISPHGPVDPSDMGVLTAPLAQGTLARWDAPDVRFHYQNDLNAVKLLREEAERARLPLILIDDWHDGLAAGLDWGCTVPLYYLRAGVGDARLVPMTPAYLSPQRHYSMGQAIGRALERLGKRVAIICSADLSHCLSPGAPGGYSPAGHSFDERYQQVIADWDVSWILEAELDFRRRAGEDAVPQTAMLMGALDHLRVRPRVLSYQGPFGVGYLVAAIDLPGEKAARETAETKQEPAVPDAGMHPLVLLAKQTVEQYVRMAEVLAPTPLPGMDGQAGAFVSIKKHGDLRGCIGTIEPTQANICIEVVRNAIAAASRDPRFAPITEKELLHLTYSVDVLTAPELVDSADCLDCKRYGIIVQSGMRRGLLLPDLEGVDSVEQQIEIAKMKAGIFPEEPCQLYRFEVNRYT